MTEYDPETLAQFDGKDGKPVYIAHQGKVYDVSNSKLWKTGTHMRRHPAGKDLTPDIQAAPHGPEMLERFPQVGVLKDVAATRDTGHLQDSGAVRKTGPAKDAGAIPITGAPKESGSLGDTIPFIEGLLRRYPMLKRHPHPMTVHFPIVFMMAVPAFNVLYLLTGAKSFELTSLHCLTAGLLFTPLVMLTGLFTWWVNYLARPLRPVNIKIAVSVAMLLTAMILFSWRAVTPDLMHSFGVASAVYFLLSLSLIPMVVVIGWHGAKLTFPFERS